MLEYFYDHQTDKLSITLGDVSLYDNSQDVAPGVVLHIDARHRPLAVEIANAKLIVGVRGLQSFEAGTISPDELSERMQATVNGRIVLRAMAGA